MFRYRTSLRWFLIASAAIAAISGTVGDAYLRWRDRQFLARLGS